MPREREGIDPIRPVAPHSVMALKSTIFKAELSIADIDRGTTATMR